MTTPAQNTLTGQTALVTGGTDGIGREVVLQLAQLGADIIVVGRNARKADALIQTVQQTHPHSSIHFHRADLSLMGEVQALATTLQRDYDRLDMLVHCAGVMLRERTLTTEGLETVFAVQFLARLSLTNSLLLQLQAAERGRVVNVSAGGTINMPFDFDNLQGEKHYDGVHALRHESVANDMLTLEWQARYPQVTFYNYGPGYVSTALLRDMPAVFRVFARITGAFIGITPTQAATDIMQLLQSKADGGLYGRQMKHNPPSDFKASAENRQRLWTIGEALIEGALNHQPV